MKLPFTWPSCVPCHAVAILAALLAAGCNAGGGQVQPSVAGAPNSLRHNQRDELLFVSDAGNNDVYIFTLPDLKLKHTIKGFNQPWSLCSGFAGNVWVPNLGTKEVLEYDRRGKQVNAVSYAHYGYPTSCAVNRIGYLAVLGGPSHGPGNIEEFFALEIPIKLTIQGFSNYLFDSYDSKGDLFVDGTDDGSNFKLGVVPANKTKGHLITVTGGTINSPGFVQWYEQGHYLAIADENCHSGSACIYSVKIAGSKGTITGRIDLLNPSGGSNCGLYQAVIDPVTGSDIVGNMQGCSSYASVDRWAYPSGGTPTNSVRNFVLVPVGAAISVK
jgi:hypothetical protein